MAISKLKKLFLEKGHTCTRNLCHYAFILSNGTLREEFNDICFARMRGGYEEKSKGIKVLRIYIKPFVEDVPELISHVKWVMKTHPECFLNKTSNWVDEGIALNCKQPLRKLFYVACLIRTRHEFPEMYKSVKVFQEHGFNYYQAIYLSHWFKDKKVKDKGTFSWAGHHGVVSEQISLNYIKNLPNSVVYPNQPPANVDAKMSFALFDTQEQNKGKKYSDVISECTVVKGEGWNKTRTIDLPKLIILLKEELL